MLEGVFDNLSKPKELITSPEMLGEFADTITKPDLIIYQSTTFVGGDFVTELTRRFNCPIVVWAVREPTIDGGRLKLNSLTGAFLQVIVYIFREDTMNLYLEIQMKML